VRWRGHDRAPRAGAGDPACLPRVSGDPKAAAARLNRSSAVLYAEPNVILRATATPNDARFGELWGLNNTGQSGGRADADIDAPEGWDQGSIGGFPSSGGITVGIVDTGIDQTYPDLAGRTVLRAGTTLITSAISTANGCTDDNDHGQPRVRHDRGDRQQRHRRGRRRVRRAPGALQGALRAARPGLDRRCRATSR
jgi:hypothetical protein